MTGSGFVVVEVVTVTGSATAPAAAYLRVYDPLEAFSERERRRWADFAEVSGVSEAGAGVARERAAAIASTLTAPTALLPPDGDDALLMRRGDRVFVCPLRLRVRSSFALADFLRELPAAVAPAFVPPATAASVEGELEEWLAGHPDERVHIQVSRWHVPLRWFALVEQSERDLTIGPASARRCRYVTPMAQARRRAARALAVVRRTVEDSTIAAGVEEVARWLEEFHPHAFVELDYGGLVHLLSDDELLADDSPARLAEGLRALADGDSRLADVAYESLLGRWRRVHDIGNAS